MMNLNKQTMKKVLIAAIMMAVAMTVTTVRAADAKENYTKHGCAGCHGKEGKGDTKLGQKLECRDYSDPKVQATLKDAEMFKAVKEGLKKGDKTLMKPYSEKLTDDEIKALVAVMKAFKK
jgi:cytochrome c553